MAISRKLAKLFGKGGLDRNKPTSSDTSKQETIDENPFESVVNDQYDFRHIAGSFWSARDDRKFILDIRQLISKQYGHLGQVFTGDNLITIGKSLSFLHDEQFMKAFSNTISANNTTGQGIIWRLYTFSWAAKSCLNKEGDFVECGVAAGSSSRIMCDYVEFAKHEKKLYLYDVFGKNEKFDATAYFGDAVSTVDYINGVFAPYPNVKIVPGFIPDTFLQTIPDKIAFLHVDLNNAAAEIAVLDHLFERVVPGGMILFDDYGFFGFAPQKQAEDNWLAKRDYTVLELPTGQGLLIK